MIDFPEWLFPQIPRCWLLLLLVIISAFRALQASLLQILLARVLSQYPQMVVQWCYCGTDRPVVIVQCYWGSLPAIPGQEGGPTGMS